MFKVGWGSFANFASPVLIFAPLVGHICLAFSFSLLGDHLLKWHDQATISEASWYRGHWVWDKGRRQLLAFQSFFCWDRLLMPTLANNWEGHSALPKSTCWSSYCQVFTAFYSTTASSGRILTTKGAFFPKTFARLENWGSAPLIQRNAAGSKQQLGNPLVNPCQLSNAL